MTVSTATLKEFQRTAGYSTFFNVLRAPWLRILGPAFAVSIGYIDPGNWATDLGAGVYGYRLLWVVFVANAIAVVLQLAVSQVTIATGEDLATLISRRWRSATTAFWVIFQGAAIATDVAEFSGIVLGIELLFHCSLAISVVAGLVVVASILLLTDRSSKGFEYALIGALFLISVGCLYQLPILHPSWSAVALGAVLPQIPDGGALLLVVGIIGATVMPHNLFLHSSLVRKSCNGCSEEQRRKRGKIFARETLIALNAAALINAAILVVGAALHGADSSFEKAFASLVPIAAGSAIVFGAALLLSGVAASMTATVSGDYIFAAFSPVRISPVIRRGATLVPAAIIIAAGVSLTNLLIWSQVALALVLPVVLVPLVLIMLERRTGGRVCGLKLVVSTIVMSLICVAFDAVMLLQTV